MVKHRTRAKLSVASTAFVLWLMLASVMGASAAYFDSESASASFTGFTSSRWMQTNRTDFFANARAHVDIDRRPGDAVLDGKTEFLFAFQGGNSRTFWRYNTSTAIWTSMANAPGQLRDDGSALASDGDRYIYAIQGGTRQFWRYDSITNSWTTMMHTPDSVKLAGGLYYHGNGAFYALRGDATTGFWRYNVVGNSWTNLAITPGAVSDGGCLVSDQGSFVYAMQGNGQRAFWRYNITSNTWSTMASLPFTVRYGGALTYDGIDSIYAIPGWSQAYLLRYSISENRWYALPNVPTTVSYGGSLAFSYPGTLFAFSGTATARYWRYDIATGLWSAATSAPGAVSVGGALAGGALVLSRTGIMTSASFDTGKMGSRIVGLIWSEVPVAGTDITFEIRASDSLVLGAPSAPWINVGGTSPVTTGLPSGQFVQWRVTLTTNNIHLTPVLQEVRVYYA